MANSACRPRCTALAVLLAVALAGGAALVVRASDHADAPLSIAGKRQDANITDLYAFMKGPNLVLAIATNFSIPTLATSYAFPVDVTFEFNIDVVDAAAVDAADPFGDGGTIREPGDIREDVTYRVRFRNNGSARVRTIDRRDDDDDSETETVAFFTGLRDDPFIFRPRNGRNSGAIVLEVPLSSITSSQSTLLIWATSKVEEFEGPFQEITGRSLRSQLPENLALNSLTPRRHLRVAGLRPDVMIYNTSLPAAFPNGRALTDDVVDLVGDSRVVDSAVANDVPFLAGFPYLAAPH